MDACQAKSLVQVGTIKSRQTHVRWTTYQFRSARDSWPITIHIQVTWTCLTVYNQCFWPHLGLSKFVPHICLHQKDSCNWSIPIGIPPNFTSFVLKCVRCQVPHLQDISGTIFLGVASRVDIRKQSERVESVRCENTTLAHLWTKPANLPVTCSSI